MQTTGYDLYLDESGQFLETSTDPAEQAQARQARPFPSQLAGLLVPRGALTPGNARALLQHAQAHAGLPLGPLHATNLGRGQAYDLLVLDVVAALREQGWQAVRLVNRERVQYGDRVAAYTNLVAELVLRICQQKLIEGQPRLSLRLFVARVVLREEDNGTLVFLPREEYLRRVQEYLGQSAVRRGVARESSGWSVAELHLRSGKDDPELQLCDLISNASHDDFSRCGPEACAALAAALDGYDFSLVFRELIERVELSLADGSFGLALVSLAERLAGDISDDLRHPAQRLLTQVIDRLARLSTAGRDPHLGILINWLDQIIEQQRNLELGYRLACWLQTQVEAPLRQALSPIEQVGLNWFAYALHALALTARNHRGALRDGRREVLAMDQLLPSLAGQWEHASLLMKGLILQAVHQTDCFEHETAAARMRVVAEYYGTLSGLFHDALPEIFPQRVRSDLHGRALGTLLQSELYVGLQDPTRLEEARRLSDQAIDEFPAQADKERQDQYRCQIETAAGRWDEARRFLARSLRLQDHDHAAIGSGIARLADGPPIVQGFALLHWLRLGATACLAGANEEASRFLQMLKEFGALGWAWSKGEVMDDYPTPGILRRVAVLHAVRGDAPAAAGALRRLGEVLAGDTERITLQTIRLAAHAETAAVLLQREAKAARRILDNSDAARPGLRQLLVDLRRRAQPDFPAVVSHFAAWPAAIDSVLADKGSIVESRASLIGLARTIGY